MPGQTGVVSDSYDGPKKPSLRDAFRVWSRHNKLGLRTSVPATVVAFNPVPVPGVAGIGTGGNASVTVLVGHLNVHRLANPLMRAKTAVLLNPARREQTLAPVEIPNVPVEFPGGAGGGMTWNILPGDTGRLAVSDRDHARWMEKGTPVDPVSAFTHNLGSSVFVPGFRSFATSIGVVDVTGTVISGTPLIKIGPNAVESITKAESLILALIQAVTNAPTATFDGGATFKAGLITQLGLIQAQIGTPAGIGSVPGKVE